MLMSMLNLYVKSLTITYTIWAFRNPTPVNIFMWTKENLIQAIVNPEENEDSGEEKTDDEDFVRTSFNSNKCDNVIVLD